MRLGRPIPFLAAAVLCATAGSLHGQVLVSLGTGSGCNALQAAQTCSLTARVTGASNAAVTWTFSPTVSGATPGTGSSPDSTGLSTNTYKAPTFITARQVVTVTATSVADPTQSAFALITLVPVSVTVLVTPSTVTLNPGQTQQFTASVIGVSQTGVTWSISPSVGTIDPVSGIYAAPSSVATSQKITVTATSNFDQTSNGTATITLNASPTITVTVSPSSASLTASQSQLFMATVQNSTLGVSWSISPQTGSIDNNGLYIAPSLVTTTQKITVTATSLADSTKTGTATITLTTLIGVGDGAPDLSLGYEFIVAYNRNGFASLVSLPPLGNVKKLGTNGYVQEFSDANKDAGVKLALATASPTLGVGSDGYSTSVVQLMPDLYAYYGTVGASTAGLPLSDTLSCPGFDPSNSCTYDFFDKGYALFAYANALAAGQDFTISGAYYTEWTNLGGILGPGRPVDVQTAITASTSTTATVQTFSSGAIYTISSGVYKGKTFGVVEPLYDLYVSQGGPNGFLGLPITEVLQVSTGVFKQTFEGGALQYSSNGGPVVQLPVAMVAITGLASGTSAILNLGQTLSLTAVPQAAGGVALTDRPVSWATSNGKVVTIQATGQSALLTAVGPGIANITASSGGVTSAKVSITVISPCCQVGDGAPASVAQAFLTAIARNKLSVQPPVSSAATRVGNGYVQMVQTTAANGAAVYMLAQADQSGTAYVVGGSVLAAYQALGGPAGALGYPISDQTSGGTQQFANNAALAGSPVRLISGGVLTKWAQLGYETGVAGPPTSEASNFSTLGANSGSTQSFTGGDIYAASAGPRSGQAYFVSGLILAQYNSLGGAAGSYGMPTGDESVAGNVHQQNFEGGSMSYAAGDSVATATPAPKVPAVVVAPSSISAGGQVRLAITGFPNNSALRVSVSGQPDFLVTAAQGAYSWSLFVPLSAKSGSMSIRAADTNSSATATGTLTVRGFADNRLPIVKVQGDNQTGEPGALLPLSLRISVKDATGAAVVGAPVVFQASPGVQLSTPNPVTDASGQAETSVRLPAAQGVTAVTADVPSIAQSPVSFYMRAAASTLPNFPQLTESGSALLGTGPATIGQKGALLTAVASILRYHQNRGELPSPNGTADPNTLDQFLTSYCAVDSKGHPLCDGFLSNPASGEQIVNLWRAAEFTGGLDVTVSSPTASAIADLLAQGSPVLLSLGLSKNGAAAGGHTVVGIGVSADGSIVIQDPSPLFARSNLNDYLSGFTAGGAAWTATLQGAVLFARRSPSATRFMVGALSQPASLMGSFTLNIQSAAGTCGTPIDLWDAVDSSGNPPPAALISRLQVCDGLQPAYQLAAGAVQPYKAFVTDLAAGGASTDISGSSLATWQVARPQLNLSIVSQATSFSAGAVVNAATFTAGIAPGGIMAVFGTGLGSAAGGTAVDFDGVSATVLSASPFQVNAVVPASLAPGTHTLHIQSPYGSAQQTVNVLPVAPAIFLLGPSLGAVVNQDNTLNAPSNPLSRGQVLVVYATGLGAVTRQGQLSVVTTPVTVLLNGQELPVSFAGIAPGSVGEYQVNVIVPSSTAPGLGLSLTLKQGGMMSNTVTVAIQ